MGVDAYWNFPVASIFLSINLGCFYQLDSPQRCRSQKRRQCLAI